MLGLYGRWGPLAGRTGKTTAVCFGTCVKLPVTLKIDPRGTEGVNMATQTAPVVMKPVKGSSAPVSVPNRTSATGSAVVAPVRLVPASASR